MWPSDVKPSKVSVLTRSIQERCSVYDGTTNNITTHHDFVLNTTEYGAVRIGLLNAQASILTGIKVIVAPTNAWVVDNSPGLTVPTSTPTPSGGSWTAVTFGGAATATLPAGTATAPTITWSDWMELSSTPRTDTAGAKVILLCRVMYPTAASHNYVPQLGVSGYGSNVSGMFGSAGISVEANAYGGLAYRAINQAVDGVTTPANMTQVNIAPQPYCPAIVQYAIPRKGRTIMTIGDSILEAATTAQASTAAGVGGGLRGFMQLGLYGAATYDGSNNPLELVNHAWGSATAAEYYARALTDIATIKPDVLVYSPFSPNSVTHSNAMSAAEINALKTKMYRVIAACKENSVDLCLVTAAPSTPGGTAGITWGSADVLRTAFNTQIRGMKDYGIKVLDIASVLEGLTDGAGQVNYKVGYTNDNLHPNVAGHAACAPLVVPALGGLG